MAPFLPVRALNRSQNVRVGNKKLSDKTTTYVDIADGKVKKALQSHSALGALQVVGQLSNSSAKTRVVTGCQVTAGTGLTVNVAAGELRLETGVYRGVAAVTGTVITANSSGNPRVDLVRVQDSDSVVSVVAGTPAASGAQAPTITDGFTPLATVAVANGAAGPGTITDVRPRP